MATLIFHALSGDHRGITRTETGAGDITTIIFSMEMAGVLLTTGMDMDIMVSDMDIMDMAVALVVTVMEVVSDMVDITMTPILEIQEERYMVLAIQQGLKPL